jgi:prolyl oligopeptidase
MTATWNAPTPWTPNSYPKARRGDHVDVYKSEKHGDVRVHDPYQWLEENSEETTAWVEGVLADTLVKKEN